MKHIQEKINIRMYHLKTKGRTRSCWMVGRLVVCVGGEIRGPRKQKNPQVRWLVLSSIKSASATHTEMPSSSKLSPPTPLAAFSFAFLAKFMPRQHGLGESEAGHLAINLGQCWVNNPDPQKKALYVIAIAICHPVPRPELYCRPNSTKNTLFPSSFLLCTASLPAPFLTLLAL